MIEWKHAEGLVPYPEAVAFMESRVKEIRAGTASECVWLVEHPPLYTAGTSARADDLLGNMPFPVYETGRGGQFTYHGPGQRVAYVMLNLKERQQGQIDIRRYVKSLELWLINTIARFGITAFVREGRIGVWVETKTGEKKIGALGIRIRSGVSYHGIALNVHPNLSHFSGIVPCGIREFGVTSLADLGVTADLVDVDAILKQEFSIVAS
ncbi:MAG: lipoyl(octanoyl) transferase LipB [Rickettsiales bacterium]